MPSTFFEKELGIKRNDDDLIMVGCSPCQYYSIINTNKTHSRKTKNLLKSFGRFVEYYNPGFILVENVPGILSNKDSIWGVFLKLIKKMGYTGEYKVLDLSYYGVPQSRKRFSLIMSRVSTVTLPLKENKRALLKDFIGTDNGFPPIEAGHRDNTNFNHTVAGLSEITRRRISVTRKDGGSRTDWKDDLELQLKCFIGKDDSFPDTFGRMSWNKPVSTITTKFFSVSNGRFAHPEEDRAISLREGATLQTFPKSYVFKTNSISSTAKLIGNAVPPVFAKKLGLSIIKSLQDGNI